MRYITQNELDGLAAMGNQVLLPLVNAAPTLEAQFANPYYDKMSGVPVPTMSASPVVPQPPYSFAAVLYQNLVPVGAVYGTDGNYAISVSQAGDYNYAQGANDLNLHDPAAGGFDYSASTTNFYLLANTITLTGTPGTPVTAVFTQSPSALLKELNRIRGDAMAVVLGDNPVPGTALFLNPGAVCSGPWVVGVNDPATWNLAAWPTSGNGPGAGQGPGILGGGQAVDGTVIGTFCIFDGVTFISQNAGATVASQFTVATTIATANVWTNSPPGYWGGFVSTLKVKTSIAGHLKLTVTMNYRIDNIMAGQTPPAVGAVGFSVSPSFGSLTLTDPTDVSTATYQFTGTYEGDIATGETDFVFNFDVPNTWGLLENGGNTWAPGYGSIGAATVTGTLTPTGLGTVAGVAVTPQADSVYQALSTSLNGQTCYLDNGTSQYYFYPQSVLSEPTSAGIWVAKTLPVPGINVFIDQDIPPHIGGMASIYHNATALPAAVSGAGQMDGSAAAPYASSMRQAVPVQIASMPSADITTVGKVNAAKPGITTRPAKWLVRRDSDFVPYDLGFNNANGNYASTLYAGQTLNPAGIGYYNVAVPPNATVIKIWLMKSGTLPGWYANNANNGKTSFSYGLPPGNNLNIYVCQAGTPALPASYDFEATGNYVTMDGTTGSASNWLKPDGTSAAALEPAYLAAVVGNGFDFAVLNPGTTPMTFDVYVQVETGTPKRVYMPPCAECYSYVIDGTPGMYAGLIAPWYGSSGPKPIPQSGYCLFKARASRLPTDNGNGIATTPTSGPALTITLGQNVLNSDGSLTFVPFAGGNVTLTIPVSAGTSGDVAIFIPVLAGNEVIYQCSAQVILEVWANWQPLWFNAMYQLGEYPYTGNLSTMSEAQWPRTTAFRTALSFANEFNVSLAGWVPPYYSTDAGSAYSNAVGSAVVWPLFRELYDDTVALLALLGGTLPSGTDAGGAGGAGSAGETSSDAPGGAGGTGGYGAL